MPSIAGIKNRYPAIAEERRIRELRRCPVRGARFANNI
jgi:hypothetical protein